MDIKQKIKEAYYHKFNGIAPEGFLLIHEDVLELLKNHDNWVQFKSDPNWLDTVNKSVVIKEKTTEL